MVRGKCILGRDLGPSWESVSVPLSEHIYSSMSTGRQELSQCHYLNCNREIFFFGWGGGSLSVRGRSSPPLRFTVATYVALYYPVLYSPTAYYETYFTYSWDGFGIDI